MLRPLLLCLPLAACGASYEGCTRAALGELATLDALIGSTEAALANGYRLEAETGLSSGYGPCNPGGDLGTGPYCQTLDPIERPRAVAADPAAERRMRDALVARRIAVERRAYRDWLDCQDLR